MVINRKMDRIGQTAETSRCLTEVNYSWDPRATELPTKFNVPALIRSNALGDVYAEPISRTTWSSGAGCCLYFSGDDFDSWPERCAQNDGINLTETRCGAKNVVG